MAISLGDIIMQQVKASAGNINLPANVKNQALSGLADSVLKGLTQTAMTSGGADVLKGILKGNASAASQKGVVDLIGGLLKKNIGGLGLDANASGALSSAIPSVLGSLSGVIKDMDGDGDVDINDIILALTQGKGGAGKGALLGAATSILGSLLKKK